MPRYWDDDWYQPSRPRPVKDGIKAKNVRGAFGASWWAKRWIAVLETFGWGGRLTRGRTYARQGQVLNIDLKVGRVDARVQGSRATPYKVRLDIPPLDDGQWGRAIDAMAEQAIFAAKLLAGEMPQTIEEAFTATGASLFPQHAQEIVTDCSCPDYANPCKHIAAVYYLLGERFDEEPFLIFHLRGRTRDQIMDALRARRASSISESPAEYTTPVETAPALADLVATFYIAGVDLETLTPHVAAPEIQAGVLRRLGTAPADTDADLRALYQCMTVHVIDRLYSDE